MPSRLGLGLRTEGCVCGCKRWHCLSISVVSKQLSTVARELSLTLLVSRIVTDNHDATVPANDLAVIADLLNAGLDLHSSVLSVSDVQASSHTDGLRELLVAVNDPTTVQVVGRKLHNHAVLLKDLDVVLTHLARDVGEHNVPVFQLYSKHRIRQCLNDSAFYLDDAFFFRHVPRLSSVLLTYSAS